MGTAIVSAITEEENESGQERFASEVRSHREFVSGTRIKPTNITTDTINFPLPSEL
jgi:hypothetical protein